MEVIKFILEKSFFNYKVGQVKTASLSPVKKTLIKKKRISELIDSFRLKGPE